MHWKKRELLCDERMLCERACRSSDSTGSLSWLSPTRLTVMMMSSMMTRDNLIYPQSNKNKICENCHVRLSREGGGRGEGRAGSAASTRNMPRPFNTAFSHADHDCSDHDCGGAFSLYKQVDTPRVRALNVVGGGEQAARLFRPWEERADTSVLAESEDSDDPEIIIHVPLTSDVKLKSIAIIGGSDGSAPSQMRVWINRDDIDFSNVGDVEPLQEWSLNDGGLEALEYPTRYGTIVPSERLSLLSRALVGISLPRRVQRVDPLGWVGERI